MLNIFVDNAFQYQILLNAKNVFFIHLASYIFNLSTNLKYNNTEFKMILMNSDSLDKSIGNIDEL